MSRLSSGRSESMNAALEVVTDPKARRSVHCMRRPSEDRDRCAAQGARPRWWPWTRAHPARPLTCSLVRASARTNHGMAELHARLTTPTLPPSSRSPTRPENDLCVLSARPSSSSNVCLAQQHSSCSSAATRSRPPQDVLWSFLGATRLCFVWAS